MIFGAVDAGWLRMTLRDTARITWHRAATPAGALLRTAFATLAPAFSRIIALALEYPAITQARGNICMQEQ